MTVHLGLYDSARKLLADWSSKAQGLRFSTDEHGYAACSFFVSMPMFQAFQYLPVNASNQIILTADFGKMIYQGRVEDISIVSGGINVTVNGFWGAYTDVIYNTFWSTASYANWRPVTNDEVYDAYPDRYTFDNQNRIFMAPTKGSTVGNSPYIVHRIVLDEQGLPFVPYYSVSFNYEIAAGMPGWIARLDGFDSNWGYQGVIWQDSGNTGAVTGTINTACGNAKLVWTLFYNGAGSTVYGAETGDQYFKVTNLRVTGTGDNVAYSHSIVTDAINSAAYWNPAFVNTNTSDVFPTNLDLIEVDTRDKKASDLLTYLASLGDSSGNSYEVGVYEDQRLFFRPKNSAYTQTYYIDVDDIELESSISDLINTVYANYQDKNGKSIATTPISDSASALKYGINRIGVISANTTSATEAARQQALYLADKATIKPKTSLTIQRAFNSLGAIVPIYLIRAGDTIVIRNIPPTFSTALSQIIQFTIGRTEYDADANSLRVEPYIPIPRLDTLLALQATQ